MLTASDLVRRFGDRVAVDGISFEVKPGEVFGLLGPNGAGKTTTLRMLGGLIPPTSGEVRIGGVSLNRATGARLRGRIGFLTETPGLWDHLTVADNMTVYARLFGLPDEAGTVERSLRQFDLWDRRSDRAALLSKGMKQKLALARALVHDPEVVLLDEPTANLDPQTAREVRDLLLDLRRRGRVVVVSTHNLDEIERLADRIALISRRLVASGEPATLRRQISGRVFRVRVAGPTPPAGELIAIAERAGGRNVRSNGNTLSMVVDDPDVGAPAVVRALVEAGAAIREACDDQIPLEEVYLKLLATEPVAAGPPLPESVASAFRLRSATADRRSFWRAGQAEEQAPGKIGRMNARRVSTLVGKELREYRSNPAAVVPVAIVVLICVMLPFVVLVLVPRVAGESLSADRNLRRIVEVASLTQPRLAVLSPDAAAQAFLFQQFLLFFLVAPIVGAVSLAAYSVVGEKQGRTLEPLLTTPLTTAELLMAKVVASFLPSVAVEAIGLVGYFALVAAFASPGVAGALLTLRSFVLVGLLGPLASLAALQMTIAISSRVNDPRSAQQMAVLLVLPLVLMLVGQVAGAFIITTPILILVALALGALWILLILFSVALFERETILTRWK